MGFTDHINQLFSGKQLLIRNGFSTQESIEVDLLHDFNLNQPEAYLTVLLVLNVSKSVNYMILTFIQHLEIYVILTVWYFLMKSRKYICE